MNLQTDIQYLNDYVYTTIAAQVYNFIPFHSISQMKSNRPTKLEHNPKKSPQMTTKMHV